MLKIRKKVSSLKKYDEKGMKKNIEKINNNYNNK